MIIDTLVPDTQKFMHFASLRIFVYSSKTDVCLEMY